MGDDPVYVLRGTADSQKLTRDGPFLLDCGFLGGSESAQKILDLFLRNGFRCELEGHDRTTGDVHSEAGFATETDSCDGGEKQATRNQSCHLPLRKEVDIRLPDEIQEGKLPEDLQVTGPLEEDASDKDGGEHRSDDADG